MQSVKMGVARFLIAAFVLFSTSSLATNPGFRIALTNGGLNYVLKFVTPTLEDALSKSSLPDISGKADSPVGDVQYSLSNIKLGQLVIPISSLTCGTGGITLNASRVLISGSANWSYNKSSFPYISDHGTADLSVSSTSLTLTATLGTDSTGHFTLAASQCSISIGNLNVRFHGGTSWLYNLFTDHIEDSLKGSIKEQFCKAANDKINNDGNKELESFPIVLKTDNLAQVNYSLLGPPISTSSYIESNHKGESQSVSNPVDSTVLPAALPTPSSSDKMLYMWFTDYVFNTAGVVYQESGVLAYNISLDKGPLNEPIRLNTYAFQDLIPTLYKTYPNMPMIVGLSVVKPPTLNISTQIVSLTVPTYITAYVIDPTSNTTKSVFILQMVTEANVKVEIDASGSTAMLTGHATFSKGDISLVSSTIGQFDVIPVQSFLDLLSQQVVIPQLNGFLNRGIEIPTLAGVSLVNSSITLGNHYVMIGTDVNYKPALIQKYNNQL